MMLGNLWSFSTLTLELVNASWLTKTIERKFISCWWIILYCTRITFESCLTSHSHVWWDIDILFDYLSYCLHFFMQNYLKDHMVLIAAFMCLKILQAGLRMFGYDLLVLETHAPPPPPSWSLSLSLSVFTLSGWNRFLISLVLSRTLFLMNLF